MSNIKGNPDSLTYFYMDTFMCTEHFLQNEQCMQNYNSISKLRFSKRRAVHKECLNHLDKYKACVIGINQ